MQIDQNLPVKTVFAWLVQMRCDRNSCCVLESALYHLYLSPMVLQVLSAMRSPSPLEMEPLEMRFPHFSAPMMQLLKVSKLESHQLLPENPETQSLLLLESLSD